MAVQDILKAFENSKKFQINEIYQNIEIKYFLRTIPNSGIQNPTALTYNQWNCGMPFICPLFYLIGRGKYKYIGQGFPFTGDCYQVPRNGGQLRLIGKWEEGEFTFDSPNINNFEEWKNKYCNTQISESKNNIKPNDIYSNDIIDYKHELMEKYGFAVIGKYQKVKNELKCLHTVNKNERLSLVYALVVNGTVKYLGKTIQGYTRPLSYLKNDIMVKVQLGVINSLNNEKEVIILAKNSDLTLKKDGLVIDLCEGYEQALIKKFTPEWNNHIQR